MQRLAPPPRWWPCTRSHPRGAWTHHGSRWNDQPQPCRRREGGCSESRKQFLNAAHSKTLFANKKEKENDLANWVEKMEAEVIV